MLNQGLGLFQFDEADFCLTQIHKKTFPPVLLPLICMHLSGPHDLDYILAKCSMIVGEHFPMPKIFPLGVGTWDKSESQQMTL